MNSEDRALLEEARRELLDGAVDPHPEMRSYAMYRAAGNIKLVLDRNPEEKGPSGGNVDVTTKDKGQIIDKTV